MVALAAVTPSLRPLMPEPIQLLDQAAAALKPWASADSSAEMVAWFVQLVRQRLRLSALDQVDLDR
jgi:hypothetical protein